MAFLLAASVTPLIHPTAPFLIELPGLADPLAPSVRMMAWIEASRSILAHPLFGTGLGSDPIAVRYLAPSGEQHVLTDGHNVFLTVAMHNGLPSLAALLVLVGFVARRALPLRAEPSALLAAGWLIAFAYHGLTGSFEDARHLWVLLGLMLAARRIERSDPPARAA